MNRKARIALSLGLVLVGSAVSPFLMFGLKAWQLADYLDCVGLGFALLIPAWLLLLPMVLLFCRFSLGRASMFAFTGVMVCSIVLIGETVLFFIHSRSNAFPSHAWFLHEFGWIAGTSTVLCVVYVATVNSASPHLSSTMQSAR